jgi:hypothetical protein
MARMKPNDLFDVRWQFSQDPAACVSVVRNCRLLRNHPFALRPWIPPLALTHLVPRKGFEYLPHIDDPHGHRQDAAKAAADRQYVPWWVDIQKTIARLIPGGSTDPLANRLADRFADYMAGYILVLEGEQVRRDPENPRRVTPHWRRARKALKELVGTFDLPTTRPPKRESLKAALTRLMFKDLRAEGFRQEDSNDVVALVWRRLGETYDQSSIARIARRSRARHSAAN